MTTRTILLIAALFSITARTVAQDEDPGIRTLLGGNEKLSHGGWGALSTHHTRIMDQDALLTGIRGGWLINHRLTIGFAGHGLTTNVKNRGYDDVVLQRGETLYGNSRFHMGYGGLFIEPVIAHRSPIHITLPLIIGAGGCGYEYSSAFTQDFEPLQYHDDFQAFFVVEQGIELEMNVIPLMRVGVGASYRYTSDLDLPATPKDALNGINAGITLKIGKF